MAYNQNYIPQIDMQAAQGAWQENPEQWRLHLANKYLKKAGKTIAKSLAINSPLMPPAQYLNCLAFILQPHISSA
jgi:hypothetical protein